MALRGFDPVDLVNNGFSLGVADLLQGGSSREVVGRTVAFFFAVARTKGDGRLFEDAVVVLPPTEVTEHNEDSILAAVRKGVDDQRSVPLTSEESAELGRVVRVLHADSLEVSDLIRTMEGLCQNSLIVVAEASRYQDISIEVLQAYGATATRLPEDRWTPHVTALLGRLAKAIEGTKRYVLVHVDEPPARRRSNQEQLFSVPHTSVFTLTIEDDPDEVVAARSADWVSMAVQGRLSDVTAELEQREFSEPTRLHTLTYLAARTGQKRETLGLLRELQPHLKTLIPEISVQAALFALRFGDEDLADELLPKCPDGVSDPIWLEAGLEAATALEDNQRIAVFDERLAVLVPGSAALRENRDRRLLMNCQDAKSGSEQHFTTAGFTEHHLELQERLSESEPDYEATIEATRDWGQEWLELAVVCCAIHARRVGHFREAADAASDVTTSTVYGRQATQVLLYSVRSMLLRELVPEDEHDHYRRLFHTAFKYLANFPADEVIRTHLISLLSVDSCGDQGVPLVALTLLDLVERGIAMPSRESVYPTAAVDLRLR